MVMPRIGRMEAAVELIGKAVAACQKAIALGPDLAEAHNNLGVAL